jgi:hypothetical protein
MSTTIDRGDYSPLFGPTPPATAFAAFTAPSPENTGGTITFSGTTTVVNSSVSAGNGILSPVGAAGTGATVVAPSANQAVGGGSALVFLIENINALTPSTSIGPTLATTTFTAGVYKSTTSLTANAITITFNAAGNSAAQFFIIAATSITLTNVTMILQNGAQALNIYWLANGVGGITYQNTSSGIVEVDGNFISVESFQMTAFASSSTLNFYGAAFSQSSTITFTGPITIRPNVVCYLKGTKILTENGYVNVEDLSVFDYLVVNGKIVDNSNLEKYNEPVLELITWIGSFKPPYFNEKSLPICIKAGALGENVPFEDLYVSPGHRVMVDDQFVLGSSLVNGTTIFQVESIDSIDSLEYYHFEMEYHSAVLANGVLSESYFDADPTFRKGFTDQKFF